MNVTKQTISRSDMDLILVEAFRLVNGHHIIKHTWTTWDVFAGRNVEHEESNESFVHRIIEQAMLNLHIKEA